ncbi:TetR/AcrR family transcriptional regulator [Schumannella soli]|uniref:TetR/AcrR family transcriptional regulator n=1 Tax=Schumannella soli TaxID=2590779 RepID=A0A506Y7R1_9MICO|nr:TetR/AcrR family transcriptional regulator [Schumannella soli]TPW77540.1 TetR/AcrR family transcriptional regulator [Schumannella soli]
MSIPEYWPAPASSGAARAQRPSRRSGQRRAEILRAATAVFGERGYANGSLNEIAERVGMTHAGVLHHFGSKEQLLIAVLEYRDDADVAELEGHHAPRGAALLDHLVETAQNNAERRGIVQGYTALLGESVTEEHPARQFFTDRYTGLRDMVTSAIADATGRSADDPLVSSAASVVIATMDGLQTQWLLDPSSVDMREAVRLTVEALVARLRQA